MNDDYLWDGSGDPDPEVKRLELMLSKFRHRCTAPEFPSRARLLDRVRLWIEGPIQNLAGVQAARAYLWLGLTAAAAFLVAFVGVWIALERTRHPASPRRSWEVARLEGSPKVGPRHISDTGRLALGEWLETDGTSRARVNVSTIGQVQVEPNTRVRLAETSLTEHRLALERGIIRATIWAAPGQFVVDTPSATVVDLGCAYSLEVDSTGAGLIQVTFGWVGFETQGRESFIPAGALCHTRPGIGPGTPYFKDASPAFCAALEKLDLEKGTPESRAALLTTVLGESRKRDAFTLWHLLSRVTGAERSTVYARLATLVPLPEGITKEGVLRSDKRMLDLWWNQLGLGDASWWRIWERPWPKSVH